MKIYPETKLSTLPCPELTRVTIIQPWGLICRKGTRLLCSDGVIRAPSRISSTADTFFSVPCAMRIKGRYVTGYMTTAEQYTTPYKRAYIFRQHNGQPNVLPVWPRDFTPEHDELIKKAFK